MRRCNEEEDMWVNNSQATTAVSHLRGSNSVIKTLLKVSGFALGEEKKQFDPLLAIQKKQEDATIQRSPCLFAVRHWNGLTVTVRQS